MPAELGGAERPPGDAVARIVEAGERPAQPAHPGEHVFLGDEDVLHHDHAGDRRAEAELPLDLRRGEPLHAPLEEKAADRPLVILGPYHADIGDRGIGDPGLGAVEDVSARAAPGPGPHRGGIGAGVGFGEAETTHPFAASELGEELGTLCLRAEGVDRIHHQRGLHRKRAAVAGIDPLDLARDQPVGDVADIGAAIARERGPEKPHLAHLVHDGAVEDFVPIGLEHAGEELLLGESVCRVADGAFLLGELVFEAERVIPGEGGKSALLGGKRCGHGTSSG